jgi:hypothetical protein
MTTIRIVDDAIELDGVTVARLLPSVRLSIRDRLTELFDALCETRTTPNALSVASTCWKPN